MFVHETGAGLRGVVGFHGWSGNHRTFAPLWERMPDGWSFFSFDLPGCGASEKPAEWTLRAVAREVAEEVVQLGMRDLVLVGSCSGAILTVFVTRALREMGRPEIVTRLVMIDPFAFCPWYFRLFLVPVLGYLMYAAAFANPIGRGLTNSFLQNKRVGDTHLTESFAGVDHRVTWRYLAMLHACGRPSQFRGMALPVDILYGEKTFSAVRQSVEEWREAFPQATVKKLAGVGHLPIAEGTAEVVKVVFRRKKG